MNRALTASPFAVSRLISQLATIVGGQVREQLFLWSLNASLSKRRNRYRYELNNQQKISDGYRVCQRLSQGGSGLAISHWIDEVSTGCDQELKTYLLLLVTESAAHLGNGYQEEVIEFLNDQMERVFQ